MHLNELLIAMVIYLALFAGIYLTMYFRKRKLQPERVVLANSNLQTRRVLPILFLVGDRYFNRCQFRKAAEVYQIDLELCRSQAKDDSPITASAHNRLGMSLMGIGDFRSAREHFNKAQLIMSEWPDQYQELHLSVADNLLWLRDETGF